MSWTLIAQRVSTQPGPTTYKVTALHKEDPSAISSEIQIDREIIIEDFQRLLPFISGIRFRSLKLKFEDYDPPRLMNTIKEKLYSSLDDNLKNVVDNAGVVHIISDDVEMPWELIGLSDDLHHIKYSVGISHLTKRRFLRTALEQSKVVSILFVVDTKENLPQTKIEVQKISSMFDYINRNDRTKVNYLVLGGKEATYHNFRKNIIQNYFDIIHVATHTEYNGIVLNDSLLRPIDIYNDVKIGAPWLVFMNSCESAKGVDLDLYEKQGDLSNLTISFLAAGATAYIGTNCIINDNVASEIAIGFYKELLKGVSIGECLRNSKNAFIVNHPDNFSWLAFRLYGDPSIKRNLGSLDNVTNHDSDSKKGKLVIRDLKSEIIQYIKGNRGSFTIGKCARDLNADVEEVMKIVSQL